MLQIETQCVPSSLPRQRFEDVQSRRMSTIRKNEEYLTSLAHTSVSGGLSWNAGGKPIHDIPTYMDRTHSCIIQDSHLLASSHSSFMDQHSTLYLPIEFCFSHTLLLYRIYPFIFMTTRSVNDVFVPVGIPHNSMCSHS